MNDLAEAKCYHPNAFADGNWIIKKTFEFTSSV